MASCAADGTPLLPAEMCLPAEPLLAANTMVGEYRIARKLGAGTFGEVYAGEHPLIGKKVAIKVLNRRFAAQPEAIARFVAEARAVNRIRQRNIIDIFAFGVLPGLQRHYFVMELLDGMTLGELCRRRRRLPFPTIVPIVRGIADALDAVHEAGITHRDLKPDNVFLAAERDGTWFPKLLDFGIAKLADSEGSHVTSTGVVLGTPQYMAPEQARGQRTGPPADIYALGVMIHRMLTGRPLFTGASAVDVMCKHSADPPPRMSSVCPDLPRELDLPVLAMLEKRAGDRPPSASKAVADLLEVARRVGLARTGPQDEPEAAAASAARASGQMTLATGDEGPASAARASGQMTLATGDEGPASAARASGQMTLATGDEGPASAARASGQMTLATGDEGPVSATWTPGRVSFAREDPATLTMDSAIAAGPGATGESWAADRRSDPGAGPASEPSGAPPSSTVPDTERAPAPASAGDASTAPWSGPPAGAGDAPTASWSGPPAGAGDASTASWSGPPAGAGDASTAPWSGPPASDVGAGRGSDADGRASMRGLAAIEAPGARVAARRRKLLIAAAAGLLAATSMWAVGRPSGLRLLGGTGAVALASAPAASPPREAPQGPAASPPPAASKEPLPPAPAETVAVRLTTRPADASVWIGDRRVGSSSEPIALPRGSAPVELVLRKPGFENASIHLIPDRDREIEVSLPALPAALRRGGAVASGPAGAATSGPAGAAASGPAGAAASGPAGAAASGPAGAAASGPAGAAASGPAGAAASGPAGAAASGPAGAAGGDAGDAALTQDHVDRILDQRE
ncbi:protein kinase domain-containing protein [Sorangium sp. So ce1335]|uniref:protein kinase domain-containing protein n=1 Tax=Sorangium sp. So ce1335 TaxID=3133335 RepID=UPI003F640B61